MKVDTPLSREFMLGYPAEAARTLEQVSVEHVAALFTELPAQGVAAVVAAMLPGIAAACVGLMPPAAAARLVTELPLSSAARIYKLLAHAQQDELAAHLTQKTRSQIHHSLVYPSDSAGALLNSNIDMLPQSVTVAEAIRRLERLDHAVSCELYVIDDAHHLVGMIDLGRLMVSNHHAKLRDIMNRKTQPISAHAPADALPSHPGWSSRHRLPVVERDNTLVGTLDYQHMRASVSEKEHRSSRDPLENMLSLATLYWLSMAQLLDSLLGPVSTIPFNPVVPEKASIEARGEQFGHSK